MMIYKIVLLLLAHHGKSLSAECEQESPCTTCQECAGRQTATPGSCTSQVGNTWAGPPSRFEAYIKYENNPNRRTTAETFPYLYFTLEPPKDSSIDDVSGFQIEILNTETNVAYCMTKNLSDCEIRMNHVYYFCIGPISTSTYFAMATSSPPPAFLIENSVSTYIKAPVYNISVFDDIQTRAYVAISYMPHNGTENEAASVQVEFLAGTDKITAYTLSLLEYRGHTRLLAKREKVYNIGEGNIISRRFNQICSGTYKIQIQAEDEYPNCVCTKVPKSSCDHCPVTHSDHFTLDNTYGAFCSSNGDPITTTTSDAHPTTDLQTDTGTSTEKRDTGEGELSNTGLIVVVAMISVVVLLIAAMLAVYIYDKFYRKTGSGTLTEPPPNPRDYDEESIGRCSIPADDQSNAFSFHPGQRFASIDKSSAYLDDGIETDQRCNRELEVDNIAQNQHDLSYASGSTLPTNLSQTFPVGLNQK